jgi:hypothetical protein
MLPSAVIAVVVVLVVSVADAESVVAIVSRESAAHVRVETDSAVETVVRPRGEIDHSVHHVHKESAVHVHKVETVVRPLAGRDHSVRHDSHALSRRLTVPTLLIQR